jgi:hypothetical protein
LDDLALSVAVGGIEGIGVAITGDVGGDVGGEASDEVVEVVVVVVVVVSAGGELGAAGVVVGGEDSDGGELEEAGRK